jgi:autotransporter translocation and assembly factor TamB
MNKIAISVLLASAFAFAQAQDNRSSLTGKWKIHSSIAGNDSDLACTFTQTSGDLAGTCVSEQGGMKVTGKLDGKKVSWSYQTEYNGSPLTVKYEGALETGKITGNVTVDPFGVSGDFTATQSPASEAAVAPAAAAPAASNLSLTGKWKIHTAIEGNESYSECTIKQTENDLAGICVSEQGTVKITGKVDGKKVAWSYESEYNGSPLTVKYNGTLDAGKITGDASVVEFGVGGEFTATLEN